MHALDPVWTFWRWLRSGRREVGLIAALFAVSLSVLAFLAVADEVREGETRAFDEAVMLALRNPADHADPIGPAWFEAAVKDITALGGNTVLTLMTVCTVLYLLMMRQRGAALMVTVSVGGGTVLNLLLKHGFDRPRPDLVAHGVDVFTLSFPSGHAMLSAITYLTLGALLARVQTRRRGRAFFLVLAVILTVLVGSSRVYLGVHWPTDVLAGWAAGAAWAVLCWSVAWWLEHTGSMETPEAADAKLKQEEG